MLCLTNYARTRMLDISAWHKSGDILRCDSFSHYACGREFSYWIRASGYMATPCWRVGENLAWGSGRYGTVASIFRAWLRSPEHRENLLDAEFTQVGIDLAVGSLEGASGAHIWTQQFGSQC